MFSKPEVLVVMILSMPVLFHKQLSCLAEAFHEAFCVDISFGVF